MDTALKKPAITSLPINIHDAPPPVPRPSRSEAEAAVRTLIAYIGDDPAREGVIDTPKRVVSAFDELYGGYLGNSHVVFRPTFAELGDSAEFALLLSSRWPSNCGSHVMQ